MEKMLIILLSVSGFGFIFAIFYSRSKFIVQYYYELDLIDLTTDTLSHALSFIETSDDQIIPPIHSKPNQFIVEYGEGGMFQGNYEIPKISDSEREGRIRHFDSFSGSPAIGQWTIHQKYTWKEFRNQEGGKAKLFGFRQSVENNMAKEHNEIAVQFKYLVQLYDGEYMNRIIELIYSGDFSKDYDIKCDKIELRNITFIRLYREKQKVLDMKKCSGDIDLIFSEDREHTPHISHYFRINLHIISSDCLINIKASMEEENGEHLLGKMWNYSFVMTIIAVIASYSTLKEWQYAKHSKNYSLQFSLLNLRCTILWTATMFMYHFLWMFSSSQAFSDYFSLPALWQGLQFAVFEMKLMVQLWKDRNSNLVTTNIPQARRELVKVYVVFYLLLVFAYLCISKYFFNRWVITFVVGSIWIPQIVYNILRKCSYAPRWPYIITISIQRLFVPLYFKCCPYNFQETEPDFTLGIIMACLVFFQIIILQLQTTFGPTFFIPDTIIPKPFQYFKKFKKSEVKSTLLAETCLICLNPINRSGMRKMKKYAQTPCGHKFHFNCLLEWMGNKLACPTCRAPLPLAPSINITPFGTYNPQASNNSHRTAS